jgi:hypothetical protein
MGSVRGRGRRLIGYGNEDDDGDLVMMDGGHIAIDVDSLRIKELGEDDEGEEEEEDEVTPKKKAKGKEKEKVRRKTVTVVLTNDAVPEESASSSMLPPRSCHAPALAITNLKEKASEA